MVYSCAYFRRLDDTLDVAQAQKLDHICRKLRLEPGQAFLDVGCGWGGLILWAAEHYGVRATGITLSQRQLEHVREETARRGLSERVEVRLLDYRDLPADAQFDRIASVGMFEHVGVGRLADYFRTLHRCLKPGGFVLNHGITHNGLHGEGLGSGIGDFVERYVFPGGELTHVAHVIEAMSAAGFELIDAEALREHYARTLWHWTERLEANADAALAEVGEERYRTWRIYMAGSAHAFDRGWLSLWQLLAGRPHDDGRLPHPLTREDFYRAEDGGAPRAAGPASAAPCCKPPGAPPSWQDAPLPHRHDHDARGIRAHLSDGLPDQDHGPPRRRLRPGRGRRRAAPRAGLRPGRGRDAQLARGQLPLAHRDHPRDLARAARRALSRAHVAPDGRDGALGICVRTARRARASHASFPRRPSARPPLGTRIRR